MDEIDSDKPPRHRIDVAAKRRFLDALRAGASRAEAAAGSGFSWRAFYEVRRRDPVFEFAWRAALELSAVDERDARRAAKRLAERKAGGVIRPNNQRLLQLRSRRGFEFTEKRQQIFLDHFAGTADFEAAAEAAGVSTQTVRKHLRNDPGFAALRDEALRLSYPLLEGEAVRQRLAALKRLRDNLEPTGDPSTGSGQDMAREFERVMKLLDRHDRRDGRIAGREVRRGRQRGWTGDEAFAALDKRLRHLGIRRGLLPPPAEDGEDGARGGEQGGQEDGTS
ncbi:MAG TPA: hypothetical protein VEA60_15250 [Allosphingosinicella sp.]|nr:hypothetical protein [Allosphingosinicella sp.]